MAWPTYWWLRRRLKGLGIMLLRLWWSGRISLLWWLLLWPLSSGFLCGLYSLSMFLLLPKLFSSLLLSLTVLLQLLLLRGLNSTWWNRNGTVNFGLRRRDHIPLLWWLRQE